MYYQSEYRNAFAVPFCRRGTIQLSYASTISVFRSIASTRDYLIMNLFYLIPRSHAQFLYPIVSWLRRIPEIDA